VIEKVLTAEEKERKAKLKQKAEALLEDVPMSDE